MSESGILEKSNDINFKSFSKVTSQITKDNVILSYYINPKKYDKNEIFNKSYAQALVLMCGDRLIKSALTANSVTIRKTATVGIYKIILSNPNLSYKIIHLDECELMNNRNYCKGTISQNKKNGFEITYFNDNDEIVIEHYSKEEVIEFMKK